jgi:hypothetical protein
MKLVEIAEKFLNATNKVSKAVVYHFKYLITKILVYEKKTTCASGAIAVDFILQH